MNDFHSLIHQNYLYAIVITKDKNVRPVMANINLVTTITV